MAIPSAKEVRRSRHRRRTRGQRLARSLVGLVVLIVLIAALGFGYFRYQWGQILSSHCSSCVAVVDGAPYNLLLIGSDSRQGETAAQAQQYGSPTDAAGQRSDTIKILHVDPRAGTVSSLSIPRDTYVRLSGLPAGSLLSTDNKINASYSGGPDALIKTIENTFGIPISHYISIKFFGVMDAVNALGGISMDFPYPARDRDCSTGVCYDNSGLDIPAAGCQVLTGYQALALSRSRYYQYYTDGYWHSDPSSDLGRIQRQNLVIEAAINKAKSTYNPISLNSLLGSVVHDFSKDTNLSATDLLALAQRYHAFSGNQLGALTLPTLGAYTSGGSAVEVVQGPQAAAMITQFLGGPLGPIVTPPLDTYGNPIPLVAPTPTSAPDTTGAASNGAGSTTPRTTAPPSASTSSASFNPRPC